jgi:hypothetical protein
VSAGIKQGSALVRQLSCSPKIDPQQKKENSWQASTEILLQTILYT